MNFIKDFAGYGSFKMSKEHLSLMWDVITLDNPLYKDHDMFYKWLKKITDEVLKEGSLIV